VLLADCQVGSGSGSTGNGFAQVAAGMGAAAAGLHRGTGSSTTKFLSHLSMAGECETCVGDRKPCIIICRDLVSVLSEFSGVF